MGDGPEIMDTEIERHKVYVLNANDDSISVISTKNNTKIDKIFIDSDQINLIGVNEDTNTAYVSDVGSNVV